MHARLPRPLTEALAGVAAALGAVALGAPWWVLVATYAAVAGLAALAIEVAPRPRGPGRLVPRH